MSQEDENANLIKIYTTELEKLNKKYIDLLVRNQETNMDHYFSASGALLRWSFFFIELNAVFSCSSFTQKA